MVGYWTGSLMEVQLFETARALLHAPPKGLAGDGRGVVIFTGMKDISVSVPINCSPLASVYVEEEGREASSIECEIGESCAAFGPILVRILQTLVKGLNTFEGMVAQLAYSDNAPSSELLTYLIDRTEHLVSLPLWALQVAREDLPAAFFRTVVVLNSWVSAALGHDASAFYRLIEAGITCPEGFGHVGISTINNLGRLQAWYAEVKEGDDLPVADNVCYVEVAKRRTYAKVYDMTVAVLFVVLEKSTPKRPGGTIKLAALLRYFPECLADMVHRLAESPAKPVLLLQLPAE